jgi:hypothetical protein
MKLRVNNYPFNNYPFNNFAILADFGGAVYDFSQI